MVATIGGVLCSAPHHQPDFVKMRGGAHERMRFALTNETFTESRIAYFSASVSSQSALHANTLGDQFTENTVVSADDHTPSSSTSPAGRYAHPAVAGRDDIIQIGLKPLVVAA